MLDKHSNECYNGVKNLFECKKTGEYNKMIEKLWNEYFAEVCSVIETNEEKTMTKRLIELHKLVNESLTKEQNEAVENHLEALLEMQSLLIKKSFFKGCEFATEFLLKTTSFGKTHT